ncbi:MAG: hypothetical protein H7199_11045 [Burkholderiales bacterium]|nr:hypothetical protein [Flavobacterium sp.]
MKTTLLLIAFLCSSTFYAQEINEENFINDINSIINDAATGFQTSKGDFLSEYYHFFTYKSNKAIFNETANVIYGEAYFSGYIHVNVASQYYFNQYFDPDNPAGIFVINNGEKILDKLARQFKLKKAKVKQDIYLKDLYLEYEYKKGKQKFYGIKYDLKNKVASINIHSDLRPDVNKKSNYKGCLVLYNIQMNSFVEANTYFIYDDNMPNVDALFGILFNKISPTFQFAYKKYEWMPNASDEQVYLKLKSLNIEQQRKNINAQGDKIN